MQALSAPTQAKILNFASNKMKLRPYQQECLDAVYDYYFKKQENRLLIQLATGGGKTVIFTTLAKRLDEPTLILAHRDELISQAKAKQLAVWPDADIGIIKGDVNETGHQITIASVQTLRSEKRFQQAFKNDRILQSVRLVIVDEAHHTAAKSYLQILDRFGLLQTDPNGPLLLGVTATPLRGDKLSLSKIFDRVAYTWGIGEGIAQGYLVPLKGHRLIFQNQDFADVKTAKGDFVTADLDRAVTRNVARNDAIIKVWQKKAEGKQTVVFCVDKEHAEILSECFRGSGIRADYLHDGLSLERRQGVLRAFEQGEITVLCNVMILTEGWDCGAVECVLMARPTQNQSLYIQCVGRGTRLHPGKASCLVLDVADSYIKTGGVKQPVSLGYILPPKQKEDDLDDSYLDEEGDKPSQKREKPVSQHKGAADFDPMADPYQDASGGEGLLWWSHGGSPGSLVIEMPKINPNYRIVGIVAPDTKWAGKWDVFSQMLKKEKSDKGAWDVWKVIEQKYVAEPYVHETRQEAIRLAEEYFLRAYPAAERVCGRVKQWRLSPPSENQLKLAQKLNKGKVEIIRTAGQASAIIAAHYARKIKPS